MRDEYDFSKGVRGKYGSCCGDNQCSPVIKKSKDIKEILKDENNPLISGFVKVLHYGHIDLARELFLKIEEDKKIEVNIKLLKCMSELGEEGLMNDFYAYIKDKTLYKNIDIYKI